MQQLDRLSRGLREVDPRIEDDRLAGHAGRLEFGQLLVEEHPDVVGDTVGVPVGLEELDLGGTDGVHQHEAGLPTGHDLGEEGVVDRRDVVDDVGAGGEAGVGHVGFVGVDREQTVGTSPDRLDQRDESCRLLLDRQLGGLGVGGLAPEVDHERTRLELLDGERGLRLDARRPVPGERFGAGVDDAEQRRAVDDDGPAAGGEVTAHGSRG